MSGYEVTFTRGFKDALAELPREVYPIIDRQLKLISADPYARNPNAKRLKNANGTFRAKIGSHIRMLYRVLSQARRVEVIGIGARDRIYESGSGAIKPLPSGEIAAIRTEIAEGKAARSTTATVAESPPMAPAGITVAIERLNWISEDELFLLQVPAEKWPAIIEARSIENLPNAAIDAATRTLIEDYWTNPRPTQVERLYVLSDGQGAATIALQPLSHFLIALDPEQRQALQRIKDDGPYLLKGSAGTGKSLVGLYHVRDLISARAGESMFDSGRVWFGIITYTNTLADANRTLLESITPVQAHAGIHCSTLDRIAYRLSKKALGRSPNPLGLEGICKWIGEAILKNQPFETAEIVERLGCDYVAEEIEQVILGSAVETVEQYIALERGGRKRGLRETERRAIWSVFEAFVRLCKARHVQTFELLRLLAMKYLEAHPDHPRFNVLFVDEAQDFSKVAKQLCLELVLDPRHLLLAADTAQSIYTVPLSWRKTDPRFDFRRRRPITLERSYRATREINEAIGPLRADPGDDLDRSAGASPVFSGPKPRWIDAPVNTHVGVVCDEVARLVEGSARVNPGHIAIIVREKGRTAYYQAALAARGVDSSAIAKGEPMRIDGAQVHIVTAHSSKGLGFPIVFVPEVHRTVYPWSLALGRAKDEQQTEQIEEKEQRLLYVALSRASHRLYMIVDSVHPSPFAEKLDRQAHWS